VIAPPGSGNGAQAAATLREALAAALPAAPRGRRGGPSQRAAEVEPELVADVA
jgi:hypothetical protein